MDIKQLESFVKVTETGSFSEAAKMMMRSQSTLTRQIRQLEVEVGRHLLHRNGRGVIATDAGKRFLAHSIGILRQVETATQELQNDAVPVGKVIVGLPPRIGSVLAAALAIRFHVTFPQATMRIVEAPTATLYEWIASGRIDAGLLNNPPGNAQMHYEAILSEDLYLVGSQSRHAALPKQVRVSDLHRYPLIIPCQPHVIRKLLENACNRIDARLNIAFEVDPIDGILALIRSGYGFGVLTPPVSLDQGPYRTARIGAPRITNHLVIGMSARRPVSSLVCKTVELVKREATSVLPLRTR